MHTFVDIFREQDQVFSFEFFPPKRQEDTANTFALMQQLSMLGPDFMTVTYGAGGGTRELTRELTTFIAAEIGIPAVAHLTCIGHSVAEIDEILDVYATRGISCILALRGDPPKDSGRFVPHPEGFSCARDLVAHIKQRGGFSIAVAGYPEGHPEANSQSDDISYLKEKVDAGADLIVTQLFFDRGCYNRFVELAREAGIEVPILPGVMPISNIKQLKRFTGMCGATLPTDLIERLDSLKQNPQGIIDFGTRYAVEMCQSLLAAKAPGIHLYTLNKSDQVLNIVREIKGG